MENKPLLQKFEGFTIWADDYKKLAAWYEETFHLKRALEVDVPLDHVIAFEIEPGSDMMLWIGSHSEVKGKNKDKYRIMISYIVDDVEEIYKKVKDKAQVISKPHLSPDGSLNVLTLMDPEDNLIQLFSKV